MWLSTGMNSPPAGRDRRQGHRAFRHGLRRPAAVTEALLSAATTWHSAGRARLAIDALYREIEPPVSGKPAAGARASILRFLLTVRDRAGSGAHP